MVFYFDIMFSASELLSQYRLEQNNSKGDSFGTISAYGSNGAIIHYSPTPETDAKLSNNSLFMVDSGGQYLEGTTDITRTFHYGSPSDDMIQRYTQVLQGSIELARVVIPDNTQVNDVIIVNICSTIKPSLGLCN